VLLHYFHVQLIQLLLKMDLIAKIELVKRVNVNILDQERHVHQEFVQKPLQNSYQQLDVLIISQIVFIMVHNV
jgi:hypothetical protein